MGKRWSFSQFGLTVLLVAACVVVAVVVSVFQEVRSNKMIKIKNDHFVGYLKSSLPGVLGLRDTADGIVLLDEITDPENLLININLSKICVDHLYQLALQASFEPSLLIEDEFTFHDITWNGADNSLSVDLYKNGERVSSWKVVYKYDHEDEKFIVYYIEAELFITPTSYTVRLKYNLAGDGVMYFMLKSDKIDIISSQSRPGDKPSFVQNFSRQMVKNMATNYSREGF